jgi:hypothetical protein
VGSQRLTAWASARPPQPLSSKSFPIHHSGIILPIDTYMYVVSILSH